MGILDTILDVVKASQANDSSSGGIDNTLVESVFNLINDPQVEGLVGLVNKFSEAGLSTQVASWIGSGENQSITADQIQSVLGSSLLQTISDKTGIDSNNIASGFAFLLPKVIDLLTPDNQISEESNNLSQLALTQLVGSLNNN